MCKSRLRLLLLLLPPQPTCFNVHTSLARPACRCLGDLWSFDPRAVRWARIRIARHGLPVPAPRWGHAVVALSPSQLLLFGGRDAAGNALHDVWVLGTGPDKTLALGPHEALWLQLRMPPGLMLQGEWRWRLAAEAGGGRGQARAALWR